jgi:DNA-binding CsgD family transcriptional regulator/sugar-specific transcriptional regulator TrmB
VESEDGSVFEAAGLGALEEEVYDLLLDTRALSIDDLSRARPEPSLELARALERLEASGLVTRAGTPQRYEPTPPDLAIEALVLRRRGELEQLRAHATLLARKYWAAVDRSDDGSLVQVVRGAEAVRQHAAQVQRAARREVVIVDRPPYVAGDARFNEEEIGGLDRGVRYRCIYDAALLDDTAKIGEIFRYVDAGEHARTLAKAPVKMLIADAEVAILPLDAVEPTLHDCAIVRGSTLLTALTACFEGLWSRSVPLSTGAAGAVVAPGPVAAPGPVGAAREAVAPDRPTSLERRIVRMLAAGVKDEAIARQLEVSSRTVNRYMDRIMGKLGANTRFQAGLQAARHGWL